MDGPNTYAQYEGRGCHPNEQGSEAETRRPPRQPGDRGAQQYEGSGANRDTLGAIVGHAVILRRMPMVLRGY